MSEIKNLQKGLTFCSEDERIEFIQDYLAKTYPGSASELCALKFNTPFQLLIATILSAQCTDERVNAVTPKLFQKYGTPEAMANAQQYDVEDLIKSTGFFRNKAKNIIAVSGTIQDKGEDVLTTMESMVALPGVGRKTANVVLSVAYGKPGLPVDTHVMRLSKRLGLTKNEDPVAIEKDLMSVIPASKSGAFSLRLILHGRSVCNARTPRCGICGLAQVCPSFMS